MQGKRMLTWTITWPASRDRSFLEFPRGGRSCRDLSTINFVGNDDKRVIKWMVTPRMIERLRVESMIDLRGGSSQIGANLILRSLDCWRFKL